MLDATRPHSIPFDRTPHAERRVLISADRLAWPYSQNSIATLLLRRPRV